MGRAGGAAGPSCPSLPFMVILKSSPFYGCCIGSLFSAHTFCSRLKGVQNLSHSRAGQGRHVKEELDPISIFSCQQVQPTNMGIAKSHCFPSPLAISPARPTIRRINFLPGGGGLILFPFPTRTVLDAMPPSRRTSLCPLLPFSAPFRWNERCTA